MGELVNCEHFVVESTVNKLWNSLWHNDQSCTKVDWFTTPTPWL